MRWVFAVALAVLASSAHAQAWIDGNGQSCDEACSVYGMLPFVSGQHSSGENFFVCAANHRNAGYRSGYNLRPNSTNACVIGYSGREVSSKPYHCLCSGANGVSAGGEPILSPSGGAIQVAEATYGLNCQAPRGNVTDYIAQQCNGRMVCDYTVDQAMIGDPAQSCEKDYRVSYLCGDGPMKNEYAPPEAGFGSVVSLACP